MKRKLNKNSLFILLTFLTFLNINNFAFANNSEKIFVIANINSQVITNIDLKKRYDFFLRTSNIRPSKDEKIFILNQLVDKLIEENLEVSAAKELEISVPDEEVEEAIEEIAKAQKANVNAIKAYFTHQKIPYDEYLNQIRNQILWKKIISKEIAPKIKISDSEVKEMFELQGINSIKTSLNLAEIFIPLNNKKGDSSLILAKKLVTELNNGSNFKEIARQFSKSPSSEFNGEIGWVDSESLDKKIYNQIKDLEIGKISPPIKGKEGYYIFKIIDKKSSESLDEKDIEQAKNQIFNKKLKIQAKSYINQLKKNSYIRIDQDKLSTL